MNAGSVDNLTMEAASPNPTMPPIIADPANSGCLDDPNFATICSFIEKFGEVCRIDALPFADLQEMIENTNEVSLPLVQLHVRLLRRVFKSIAVDKWERSLAKFGHTYCNQDGWEIERFGYKKAKIQTKLRLLKNLLEAQFDFNVKFKSEVNKIPASDLRLVPLGRDTEGQLYWYQVDPDANLRVYREDVDDETWEVVATSKEEMMELINQLQRREVKKPIIPDDEVIVEEDSNGKDIETKEILLDTGKVQDEDEESDNEIDDDEPDWKETDDSVDEEAMEIDEEYVAPEEVVVNPTVDGDSKVDVFVNASNNLTLNPSDRVSENADKVNISSSEWSIKGSDPKSMSALHSEFVANSYMRSQKVEPLTLRKEMFREEKINTSSYPYIAVKSKVKYEEPLPSFETSTNKCLDVGYKREDNKSGNNDVVADEESVKAKLENQTIGTLDYTTKQSEEKKVKNEQGFLKNQLPIDLKAPTTQMEAKPISSTKASIQVLGSKSKANEAKPPPFTLHASSIQKGDNDKPPLPEKFSTRQLDSKSEDSKRKQLPITLDISINEISNKTPSSEKVSTLGLVAEPVKNEAKQSPKTVDISSTKAGNKLPSPVKVTMHNIVSKAEFPETRQPHFTLNTSRKEDTLPLPEKVTTQGFGSEPKYSESPFSVNASYMQMENKEPENLSVRTRTQVPDNKHKEAKQSKVPIIASDIPIIQAKGKSFSSENVSAKDVGLKPDSNETQPRIEKMEKPVDKIDNKIIDVKPEHVPDTIEKHSDITQCKDKILVQDEMSLSHDTQQFLDAPSVNQPSTTVSDNNHLDIDAVQEIKGEELKTLLRGKKLNNPPKIIESNNPPKTEEYNIPPLIKESVQPLKTEESIHPLQIEESIHPPQIEESIHPPQIEESIHPPQIEESIHPPQIEESIHPPQIEESIRLPQIEKSIHPPQIDESIHPPQIEESIRLPQIEESIHPPQIEKSIQPLKTEESIHSTKIEESIHPPKIVEFSNPTIIKESIHPLKIKESVHPPKLEESIHPPKLEEPIHPPKLKESIHPPKLEESIHPPKLEESIHPMKIKESSDPPKMAEFNNPPKMEESSKPQKMEEFSTPPKIAEFSDPPMIAEFSNPPKIEEFSSPPKIAELSKPPEIAKFSNPPEIVKFSKPPEIAKFSNPPEIVKFSNPPEIAKFSNPPEIAKFSNPPEIAKFSNPPEIAKFSNTPIIEDLNKFPQNVEPSKSLITEECNKSWEKKQFDEFTQKEELVTPKQDVISSKHEELSLPLRVENIPQTNEALNIPSKCEELSIPLRKEKENEFHKSESVNEFSKKDESIIPPAKIEESNGLLKQKESIDSQQVSINEYSKSNVSSLDNPPQIKSEESIQVSQTVEFKERTLKSSFETPESTVKISHTYDTNKVLENTSAIEQSLKSKPLITETTESPTVSESDTTEAISVDQSTSIHEIKSHVEIDVPTQSVPPEVSTSKPDLSTELGGDVSSKQNSQIISEPRPSLDLDEIDSDDGMEISDLVIDTNDEPQSVEETKDVPSVDIRATEENSTSISESQLSPEKPVQVYDAPVDVSNDNTVISKSKEVNNKPEEAKFVDESQTTAKNCSSAPSDTTSETSINVTATQETENDSKIKFSDNVILKLEEPVDNVKEIVFNADITSTVKIPENKDASSGRLDVSTSKSLESRVQAAVVTTDAPQINTQVQKENPVNNPSSEESPTVAIVEKLPVELTEHKPEIAVNIPGDLKAQSPVQVRPSVESNETSIVPLEGEKDKLSNESFPAEITGVQEAAVSNEERTDTATNKIDSDLATTSHARPSELVTTKAENDTIPATQISENASESSLELKSAESSNNEKAADELSTVMPSVSSDIESIQQPLISTDLPKNESINNTASDSKSKEEEISKPAVSGLVGYEYSSSEDEGEMSAETSTTREPISSEDSEFDGGSIAASFSSGDTDDNSTSDDDDSDIGLDSDDTNSDESNSNSNSDDDDESLSSSSSRPGVKRKSSGKIGGSKSKRGRSSSALLRSGNRKKGKGKKNRKRDSKTRKHRHVGGRRKTRSRSKNAERSKKDSGDKENDSDNDNENDNLSADSDSGDINKKRGKKRKLRSRGQQREGGRKLRPKRNCAPIPGKGKLKDISGESEDEIAGSSGEEWIMRGELGKKKRRIVFGDGSDFRRPGWEEELIDFKKKLRMPSKLIRVSKPSSLSMSPAGTGTQSASSSVAGGPTFPAKDEKETSTPTKTSKENKMPTPSKGVQIQGAKGEKTPEKDDKTTKDKEKKPKGRPPKNSTASPNSNASANTNSSTTVISGTNVENCVSTTTPKKAVGKSPGKLAKGSPKVQIKLEKIKSDSETMSEPAIEQAVQRMRAATKRDKSGGPKPPMLVKIEKEELDKVSDVDENGKGKSDKEIQMLPTPGPAATKFNKKMSIKSVFGVDLPMTAKKTLRRNKFKSGFDYIRKKKKAAVLTPDGSIAPPPPKRVKTAVEKNMNVEDIQVEMRGWVLNKGLGETALHRAARLGYPDVAAYCLEHDVCSPNCKDNAGYSPLHETCIKGNLEVAKVLLAYGANPSQAAPGGIRPLHEACENGHVELVRLIISYGADPLLATYAGQTPLELAENHRNVKLLLEQHINDVQGKEDKPWEFRGSGAWAEAPFDNGYDVTADPPNEDKDDDNVDGFEFESSENPLPLLYKLKGESPDYILFQDLLSYVGQARERFMKNHPTAEIVELNSNDFLEQAQCCHLLGEKFNLNSSSDLLTLVKYDDKVKKMLNIESCIIK